MPGKFPHTMTKGAFRGQRFETQTEYNAAVRRLRQSQRNTSSNASRVISAYELLMESGVGRSRAVQIIDQLTQ